MCNIVGQVDRDINEKRHYIKRPRHHQDSGSVRPGGNLVESRTWESEFPMRGLGSLISV